MMILDSGLFLGHPVLWACSWSVN